MCGPDKTTSSKPLAIEHFSPSTLTPDPLNPRSHNPPQIAAIARSIQTFGFNVPVLTDSSNTIIAGHGRVAAAIKLGLPQIPVVRVDHLSEHQRRAYMIADNRLSTTSRWNDKLLGDVLRDLTVADLDFELDAIGFSVGEIDMRIDLSEIDSPEENETPLPVGPPVIKPGDLWLLGPHRLLCGNSQKQAVWQLLMAEAKATMVFADPPYNVAIQGHVSGLGKHVAREFAMASGEMDRDAFTAFLSDVFMQMTAHTVTGSMHYICMDWRHMGEMIAAGEAAFTELKNLCVWVKHTGGMGSLYRSRHELIFVWKNGRAKHRNNVELGRQGRNRENVWQYPAIGGFRHSEDGDLLADHPTCKPVKLVADAILDVTARGDIVVDPFMGSGTTLMAAQRVGRRAYGLELDPLYCDTIIRRWEAMTGDKARHAGTGRAFAEVGETRGTAEEQAS